MRNILFAVALAAAAGGCAKSEQAAEAKTPDVKVPELTIDQVDKELAANTIKAVDCNGDETRKKAGVIPGAILVDDEEKYAQDVLPADKATKLVFYCGGPG